VIGGWRENYRALGEHFSKPPVELTRGRDVRWRVGPPVDASGATPDGRTFSDLAEYKRLLLAEPDVFTRALTGKIAVYAAGRPMGFSDRPELERITRSVAAKGQGLRDLIHAVVHSDLVRSK
jgi:hypothetical protein